MGELLAGPWTPEAPRDAVAQPAGLRPLSNPVRPTMPPPAGATEPLWRTVAGQVLRDRRAERAERLADVAGRAGISVPYLSEIERGRKEPSSEVLAAVCGALELRLVDLTAAVLHRLRPLDLTGGPHTVPTTRPQGPVALAA